MNLLGDIIENWNRNNDLKLAKRAKIIQNNVWLASNSTQAIFYFKLRPQTCHGFNSYSINKTWTWFLPENNWPWWHYEKVKLIRLFGIVYNCWGKEEAKGKRYSVCLQICFRKIRLYRGWGFKTMFETRRLRRLISWLDFKTDWRFPRWERQFWF